MFKQKFKLLFLAFLLLYTLFSPFCHLQGIPIYINILNCYSLTFCFNFFFFTVTIVQLVLRSSFIVGSKPFEVLPRPPPPVSQSVSKFQMQMEQGKRKICLANNKYFLNQFSTCSAIQFCLVNSSFFFLFFYF